MVASFAVDYYCLMSCMPNSFLLAQAITDPLTLAFDFLYFSIVTFATIGYGDIVPLVWEAKLLVLLEIISSFIMITFVISNLRKINNTTPNKN
ncbi:MAG: potassium channel family protein [Reichenbachiella sp.]|uniref:potassium channel family protein n=1 Tax=Reichenbachiella sp. TaxID=2184521 RepID=UPI002965ED56|nr:potassium channel family protein [Reichenbachiella sp.]MDW3212149.1 potassium channel family protein [Reichenbachiella sp.]